MPRFFSNKRLIILLVGVIILVALIGFSLRDRDNVTLPEQFIKDAAGIGQTIISRPASFVAGAIEQADLLLDSYEENRRLKARLEEYASVQAEVADLRIENEELRKIVGKEEDLRDFNPIQANVIGRNPDQWENRLILDQGSSKGIAPNMAVMTANGLIGKVATVTPLTSTVELLTSESADYRVSAIVTGADAQVHGLIEGYDAERGELLLKRVASNLDIQPGQQVVTSGLGGVFPRGIVIGEITEVTVDEFGLTKLAYVKPSAEFPLLDHVMIADRIAPEIEPVELNGLEGEEE
ncbi:rod shape-determining protein MreC [Planococcus lenghuensis]|uniref:Cell shape-determining protein MreC n=1 Tax=Planococcus lenghuensis TaxID=2213202 RepID=A0A1Q2KXG1_9BACL|nr:rod shape-determining protein MreC [Planococcus lenghuensis]AQQ52898.1 rod shape-determining protein MreC [Planococcus lenghuensis]